MDTFTFTPEHPEKINMIFGYGNVKIEYPNCVELLPEHTVYHAERCSNQGVHKHTLELLNHLFMGDIDPITEWIPEDQPIHVKHAFGLIDMTLKFFDKKASLVWKFPETYLHPRYQAQLGDIVIQLNNYKNGKKIF